MRIEKPFSGGSRMSNKNLSCKSESSGALMTLYRQVSDDKDILQLCGALQMCLKNTKLVSLFFQYKYYFLVKSYIDYYIHKFSIKKK